MLPTHEIEEDNNNIWWEKRGRGWSARVAQRPEAQSKLQEAAGACIKLML